MCVRGGWGAYTHTHTNVIMKVIHLLYEGARGQISVILIAEKDMSNFIMKVTHCTGSCRSAIVRRGA